MHRKHLKQTTERRTAKMSFRLTDEHKAAFAEVAAPASAGDWVYAAALRELQRVKGQGRKRPPRTPVDGRSVAGGRDATGPRAV